MTLFPEGPSRFPVRIWLPSRPGFILDIFGLVGWLFLDATRAGDKVAAAVCGESKRKHSPERRGVDSSWLLSPGDERFDMAREVVCSRGCEDDFRRHQFFSFKTESTNADPERFLC